MALEIDALATLRVIAAHHDIFSSIRSEVSKAQGAFIQKLRALLVKQIKSSASDIGALKEIRKALGNETFDLVVDGMKDTDIKAIVAKADKHHPEQKTANSNWRRQHLVALVTGAAQPSPKAAGKAKAVKAKASKSEKGALDFLFDESAGAVRKR